MLKMMARTLLLVATALLHDEIVVPVEAFQAPSSGCRRIFAVHQSRFSSHGPTRHQELFSSLNNNENQQADAVALSNSMDGSTQLSSSTDNNSNNKVNLEASKNIDKVNKWREEAERIRLEAAQLDSDLTTQKIATLESKLANQSWLERNPDEAKSLQEQLDMLKNKRAGRTTVAPTTTTSAAVAEVKKEEKTLVATTNGSTSTNTKTEAEFVAPVVTTTATTTLEEKEEDKAKRFEENPLCGYDQEDLDLYVPVVTAIEERMPSNATLDEKLTAFRAAPELQDHFQEKIRKMIQEPLEEMMKLEQLKQDYLSSSSTVERKQIKREIDQLEKGVEEEDGMFMYSDTIMLQDLPPLLEAEIQQRMEAVGALPPILQALYKKRCGVNETTGDLRLAIEMDHFEPQLQLLEQVRYLDPITDEVRHEIRIALLSLPVSVRDHFARSSLELENGADDISAMIEALVEGAEGGDQWMTLKEVVIKTNKDASKGDDDGMMTSLDLPEYNDLDFMDRSRYVKEFVPSVTRLEAILPPMEDIETLMAEVLDRKSYMVTSSPERFLGGYYIRGQNMFSDPETGSGADDLVSYLQEKLQKSSLKDKIDLFYIQDPSPPTDEEYEMGEIDRPVLMVTAKNREQLYDNATAANKITVSLLGLVGVMLFAAATTQMQPLMRDQVEAAAAGDLSIDISPIISSASQVFTSLIAIQLAHELGHRVIAWRDKFDVGLPTLIPSIQLGLQGAITPFTSPPPSNKSMFDFAMAGPIAGLIVSFGLLIAGLDITATMDIDSANILTAFPVSFLRSSALCGGMIEFFIGKGALTMAAADAVLPLHPFAIAGFAGIISNSLALLPLGNTDGGRISQVMFGRRGAYLVKIFTTLVLCAMGIFGLDEPRTFLTYVLFAMIWQRELESPTRNESDELDFSRGLVGIGSAIIVTLALLPMF